VIRVGCEPRKGEVNAAISGQHTCVSTEARCAPPWKQFRLDIPALTRRQRIASPHLSILCDADGFCFQYAEIGVQGQWSGVQALEWQGLGQRLTIQHHPQTLLMHIQLHQDRLSGQLLIDIVDVLVNLDTAVGADPPPEHALMLAPEPGVGVDHLRECGQAWQLRKRLICAIARHHFTFLSCRVFCN